MPSRRQAANKPYNSWRDTQFGLQISASLSLSVHCTPLPPPSATDCSPVAHETNPASSKSPSGSALQDQIQAPTTIVIDPTGTDPWCAQSLAPISPSQTRCLRVRAKKLWLLITSCVHPGHFMHNIARKNVMSAPHPADDTPLHFAGYTASCSLCLAQTLLQCSKIHAVRTYLMLQPLCGLSICAPSW